MAKPLLDQATRRRLRQAMKQGVENPDLQERFSLGYNQLRHQLAYIRKPTLKATKKLARIRTQAATSYNAAFRAAEMVRGMNLDAYLDWVLAGRPGYPQMDPVTIGNFLAERLKVK